jgi:hypothetical protein
MIYHHLWENLQRSTGEPQVHLGDIAETQAGVEIRKV